MFPAFGIFILLAIASATTPSSTSSESSSASSSRSSSSRSFSDFYDQWIDAKVEKDLITLKNGEEPRLIRSNNIDEDFYEYLSDYYKCVGDTGFNGPYRDIIDDIKNQCKKNGATVALYSIEYSYTTPGSYSIRRYDFTVYYLVKWTGKPSNFGFGLIDLSATDRRNLEINTGTKVNFVYKYTPAFYANFLRDDIIISINKYKVTSADDFYLYYILLSEIKVGEEIEIEFIRKNEVRKNKIKIE
jgi:hypothetical protein